MNADLMDKVIILKTTKHAMPMPTNTDKERRAFWDTLMNELPCFIDHLLKWQISDRYKSERYGVTHYHDPESLESLSKLAPEVQLLEMLYTIGVGVEKEWTCKADELEEKLIEDPKTKRRAVKLLEWQRACSCYLGRLRDSIGRDFFKDEHKRTGNVWTINLPQEATA